MHSMKWGVLGPGRIAHRFAEALVSLEGHQLQAVHSSSLDRATAFGQKYSASRCYDDLNAFLNDETIEVVYIAYPHRYHADAVTHCLNAGKHVLCEKPLAVTALQAKSLMQLAEDKGLFLMEAVWTRFLPVWQQVDRWIKSETLGAIQLIQSNFGMQCPRNMEDRMFNLELAGGSLLDMGVYCIALSQFVIKQNPSRIVASVNRCESGVDDRDLVTLEYPSGASSQFCCTLNANLRNDFIIYGSAGSIRVDDQFWNCQRAVLSRNGEADVVFDQAFACNGFEYQIEEVAKCIRGGKQQSDIMPWTDTLANQRVMDEILQHGPIHYPFL